MIQDPSNNKNTLWKDVFNFLSLVVLIYICYLSSAVYHEKILKQPYKNTLTGQKAYFQQAIVFTLFPQFFAVLIGYLYKFLILKNENQQQKQIRRDSPIPWKNALICGLLINFNMFTYNQAVVEASFPAVVMVKSCSLLSVILVGVCCSRVKDKSVKLKANKIVIGTIACLGIFVFNFFKKPQKKESDRPIQLISSLLLIASLIGDGFLPDLQAEIKTVYKPTVMEMYTEINKFTFLVSLTYSLVSLKIFYFIDFFMTHDEIIFDILALSILNSLGQIVIYRMVKLYKQHIPAFVIGLRKCLTVILSIFYFHHEITNAQYFALIFVFGSIMLETYDNYKQKLQQQEIKKSQQDQISLNTSDQIQLNNKIGSSQTLSPTQTEEDTIS